MGPPVFKKTGGGEQLSKYSEARKVARESTNRDIELQSRNVIICGSSEEEYNSQEDSKVMDTFEQNMTISGSRSNRASDTLRVSYPAGNQTISPRKEKRPSEIQIPVEKISVNSGPQFAPTMPSPKLRIKK